MEQINKLQPNRTISLRGFDGFGAAAAITQATETGFTVSGVFRATDDFTVLTLFDADDFWGHPLVKYLPDFDFTEIVLEFDIAFHNLMTFDDTWYPSIDWLYVDMITAAGDALQVQPVTSDASAYPAPTLTVTVEGTDSVGGNYLVIWQENNAYSYTTATGDTAEVIAAGLAAAINTGSTLTATASGAAILITTVANSPSGNLAHVYCESQASDVTFDPATAEFSGAPTDRTLHVTVDFTELTGNNLTTGATFSGPQESIRQIWMTFAPRLPDGSAFVDVEWSATFSNWTVTDPDNVRPLQVAGPNSVRMEETDWACVYTGQSWASEAGFYSQGFANQASTVGDSVTMTYNCQLTHDLYLGTALYIDRMQWGVSVDGDAETLLDCYLNTDPQVVARRVLRTSLAPGAHTVTLTVRAPSAASTGTGGVYFDFIEAAVTSDVPAPAGPWLNRSPAIDYDTDHGYRLPPERLLWMLLQLGYQGPIDLYAGVFWWMQKTLAGATFPSASVDFSQMTYVGGSPVADGDQVFLAFGDSAVSANTIGITVWTTDDATSLAARLMYRVNANSVGVWASAEGSVLTLTARALSAQYQFPLTVFKEEVDGTIVELTFGGSLATGGVEGNWNIDPTQTPTLNAAAAAWFTDFYTLAAAAGLSVTTAYSMELVNPPDDPVNGHVWAARYADGYVVETATGFGTLNSTQCAPGASEFLAYQTRVYLDTAALAVAAGLTPEFQFGEFLWWFFSDAHGAGSTSVLTGTETPPASGTGGAIPYGSLSRPTGTEANLTGGMAYYDNETNAAAEAALGRPLYTFVEPTDDPTVNGGADVAFLQARLAAHVNSIGAALRAAYPDVLLELLWPYDVNYPVPIGRESLGGRLNFAVNLPPVWTAKVTSGLDRFKMEALDFGSGTRSLDLAAIAIAFPTVLSWPLDSVRYLFPVFNGGCPWQAEYLSAVYAGILYVTPFAFDHVCLFAWSVEEPVLVPTAQVTA
jgi:hypothetical protein